MRNDTIAYIGNNTTTNARQDIEVNALSKKDIKSVAVSAGGALIGVAGSVSVQVIGTLFDDDSQSNTAGVAESTDKQARGDEMLELMQTFNSGPGSGDSDIPDFNGEMNAKMAEAGNTMGDRLP